MTTATVTVALKEALARRLYGLSLSSNWIKWDDLGSETKRGWEVSAGEALRCMEWGRRIGIAECERADDYSWAPYTDPLTLPPDAWTPE